MYEKAGPGPRLRDSASWLCGEFDTCAAGRVL